MAASVAGMTEEKATGEEAYLALVKEAREHAVQSGTAVLVIHNQAERLYEWQPATAPIPQGRLIMCLIQPDGHVEEAHLAIFQTRAHDLAMELGKYLKARVAHLTENVRAWTGW